ncbi:MAG: hypothetical protein KC415_12995, partial [Anaerolineales bacterium]|nr:hypothetical protein [Anaerolineales bacterium]
MVEAKDQLSLTHFRKGAWLSIVSSLIAIALLIGYIYWQQSIYVLASAQEHGDHTYFLSDLFDVERGGLKRQLPFPLYVGQELYYTHNCEYPEQPAMIKFSTGRIQYPRKVYLLLNLQEGFATRRGQSVNGRRIGAIAFEFDVVTGDRFRYYDLIAGVDVREWLIGVTTEEHITTTLSPMTEEIYRSNVPSKENLTAVLDLVTLDIPLDAPNAPLVGVWIIDDTLNALNDCAPGLQIA